MNLNGSTAAIAEEKEKLENANVDVEVLEKKLRQALNSSEDTHNAKCRAGNKLAEGKKRRSKAIKALHVAAMRLAFATDVTESVTCRATEPGDTEGITRNEPEDTVDYGRVENSRSQLLEMRNSLVRTAEKLTFSIYRLQAIAISSSGGVGAAGLSLNTKEKALLKEAENNLTALQCASDDYASLARAMIAYPLGARPQEATASSWERSFLNSVLSQRYPLTKKQDATLMRIADKLNRPFQSTLFGAEEPFVRTKDYC